MGVNVLVHSGPKVGKTWLGETSPAPKLFLQSGGETRFTRSKKTLWDPMLSEPPRAKDLDTVVATVTGPSTLDNAYQWLLNGEHDFKSVILDNYTLIQKINLRETYGGRMTQNQFGEHLPQIERQVTEFRNLVDHPTNPLDLIMFCVGSKPELGKYSPFLMGQIKDNISYIIDVVGYLYTELDGDTDLRHRKLLIEDHPGFVAGTRVHSLIEKFGSVITDPNMTDIVAAAT